jgi:hypothetical protein
MYGSKLRESGPRLPVDNLRSRLGGAVESLEGVKNVTTQLGAGKIE